MIQALSKLNMKNAAIYGLKAGLLTLALGCAATANFWAMMSLLYTLAGVVFIRQLGKEQTPYTH